LGLHLVVGHLKNSIIFFLLISFLSEAKAQQYTPKKIDSLISLTFQLADRNEALKISNKTYQGSEEIGYYLGKAKSLKADLNSYLGLGEQEKALNAADKLYNIAKKESDPYHQAQAYIAKSIAYAYLGFFEKAAKTTDKAEELCKDIQDNDDKYSSLGQIYAAKAEIMNLQYETPQNTLKFDLKSINCYKKIKNRSRRNGWLSIQYSSVGYTYIDLDDYQPALYYNRQAYELAKVENDSINQAFGLYGLGNTYLEMNKSDSSVYYYKQALPIFEKANDIYRLQYIYDDLALIYEQKGDDKIYSYYTKKSRELAEIIRKKERLETDKVSNNIIDEEKQNWYRNLYIFIGIMILLAVIFFFFTIKFFKSYKEEKEQKENIEDDLIEKEEELNHLELKVNDAFAELLELAKNNDSSFLSRFKEVYPYFYNKLITNYPELTNGQLQFCALLKLNFTTKEIAHYNNISVRSVETRKNRLRKQLDISSEIDLNKWMMDF
jgi:tetratricopeptide (TPR) repeat protein